MMHTLVTIILAVSMWGCAAVVPVKQPFPSVPASLEVSCPPLLKVEDNSQLHDMLTVVVKNYELYYICANKTHGWQEWYNAQKNIHDIANR